MSGLAQMPRFGVVITALGIGQIFAWGSSYYLLAVLAKPIAHQMGWSLPWVIGGLSIGLLIAGLFSPRVGRIIQRHGGRPVLAASSLMLSAGLALLAASHNLGVYVGAWIIMGLGMGAGLYDPAFATLGRIYGEGARSAITTLTLFGGFASTVCWPLSAFLVAHLGWRDTCLAYAAFHLCILFPAYLRFIPNGQAATVTQNNSFAKTESIRDKPPINRRRSLFALLATAVTLSAMISTLLSVHLLTILQSRGVSLAAAVGLGALVGPSQAGARTIELFIAKYHHPIWTKIAATSLVTIGVAALWSSMPILAIPLVFYGAGIGLESIARGTLPLALFAGPEYAVTMGKLAMPSLIVQAATPSLGAFLIGAYGAQGTLAILVAIAAINLILVGAIWLRISKIPKLALS